MANTLPKKTLYTLASVFALSILMLTLAYPASNSLYLTASWDNTNNSSLIDLECYRLSDKNGSLYIYVQSSTTKVLGSKYLEVTTDEEINFSLNEFPIDGQKGTLKITSRELTEADISCSIIERSPVHKLASPTPTPQTSYSSSSENSSGSYGEPSSTNTTYFEAGTTPSPTPSPTSSVTPSPTISPTPTFTPTSTPTSTPRDCTCDMRLFLAQDRMNNTKEIGVLVKNNNLTVDPEYLEDYKKDPTINTWDAFLPSYIAYEKEKYSFEFTFKDVNNCYEPKLKELILTDSPKYNPPKNHDKERVLKFDVKIPLNRKRAKLITKPEETIWYGVKEGDSPEAHICFNDSTKSVYDLTFDARFDIPQCNTVKNDTFEVRLIAAHNAYAGAKMPIDVNSSHLSEAYLIAGEQDSRACCVGLSDHWTKHPISCEPEVGFDGPPESYKQLWPKTYAEEHFHTVQLCNPALPWSKGGKYGSGGPLTEQVIRGVFNEVYPNDVCIPFSKPSKRKRACAIAKAIAAKTLKASCIHTKRLALSKPYRAWLEWTAKEEIEVTEDVRAAIHYTCAYGRNEGFPYNNPPMPTDHVKNILESIEDFANGNTEP